MCQNLKKIFREILLPKKLTYILTLIRTIAKLFGLQPYIAVNHSDLKISPFGLTMSIVHLLTFTTCFFLYYGHFVMYDESMMCWGISDYMSYLTAFLLAVCVFTLLLASLLQRSRQRKILKLICAIEECFLKIGVTLTYDIRWASRFLMGFSIVVTLFHALVCIYTIIKTNHLIPPIVVFVKTFVILMPYFYLQVFVITFIAFCIFCKIRYDKLNCFLVQNFGLKELQPNTFYYE